MKLVLMSPDWRPENLARIRDVVDQTLSGLRNRMQSAEENWVNDPADAFWRQDNPLLLTTSSFLTRAHNVHRLRWMLKDAGSDARPRGYLVFSIQSGRGRRKAKRDELKILLGAMQGKGELIKQIPPSLLPYGEEFTRLSPAGGAIAVEAAKDLEQLLADIPDATLASDWEYLARQIQHDLLFLQSGAYQLECDAPELVEERRCTPFLHRFSGITHGVGSRHRRDCSRGSNRNPCSPRSIHPPAG